MTLAIAGLAVAIVFPIAMDPDPSWPVGYLAEAVFGMVLGVGLGLGGYWLGAGRFLPEHDRWSLPVAGGRARYLSGPGWALGFRTG